MSAMEDRLRAALQAKAGQVTEARLTAADLTRTTLTVPEVEPSEVSRIEPGMADLRTARHARWFAPSLAVAAVALVAVAASLLTSSANDSAPRPAPPAHSSVTPVPTPTPSVTTAAPTPTRGSTTPTHTAPAPSHSVVAQAMLGNGLQGARTAVPWGQVGTGWTVALWTPDTRLVLAGQVARSSTERLYLVDPLGGRYLITELPANTWQLADFSGDGRRALLLRNAGATGELAQVDLQTGLLGAAFDAGTQVSSASYTKPEGKAVVVVDRTGLHKLDLDGSQQLAEPAVSFDPMYRPDGSSFLVGGTPDLRVYSNTGPLLRTIKAPAGSQLCVPIRWSTPTVAVVACNADVDGGVWLIPTDGGAPTALLSATGTRYGNAAQFGSQLVGESDGGAPCSGSIGVVHGSTFIKLSLPGWADGTDVGITGVTSTSVRISLTSYCRQTALLSYDPATGSTTTLLGGSLDGGTILGSQLYRATDPKD